MIKTVFRMRDIIVVLVMVCTTYTSARASFGTNNAASSQASILISSATASSLASATNSSPTLIPPLTRPMKYYGVDRGSPFTTANYDTLVTHDVKTIIVQTMINDSKNSSNAKWANVKALADSHNFNYVIWPDQGGDVPGCGWEDPYDAPDSSGNYIWRVTTMLDSFATDPHFIGIVSAHEPMWNTATCKTSIPDLVAIKSQLKNYMNAKGRTDWKVWAYIDNITDLANMPGYVPQDIQNVMDAAVTWQHCFGGAEGTCASAKNKIIADRALITNAGLDGKVDLIYLFQTFGMGAGSGYTMPTLADMQAWDCQFIGTNALDGFIYYTWGAWYTTDLINHPELWPEMNRVYEQCINQATQPTYTFLDVPSSYWAYKWIESIYQAGITGGCSTTPLMYCPAAPVTRDQMAVFLERAMHGSSFTPPNTPATFNDTATSPFSNWIEALKSDGITGGCGNGNYCPSTAVTRDQMAVFLLRAKHGSSYVPPAATGTKFADVPASNPFAAWIEELANEGISSGCDASNYCPASQVTRDQMAVFIQHAFNLAFP